MLLNFAKSSKNNGNFWEKIEIAELCRGVHCVDLGESCQTHPYLQNLASIQPRTSPQSLPDPSRCSSPAEPISASGAPNGPLEHRRRAGRRFGASFESLQFTLAETEQSTLCTFISWLYQNDILQVKMRLKALAEIYTMHSFALL